MHPFKGQAEATAKTKAGNMGKSANKDIPIMRAVGENSGKKLYSSSSNSMQHKNQSAADGMKRGGHVGKHRHSKPKIPMVVPEAVANPPSPDPSMAAAGAGSSPAPAPPMMPPGQPPMKRGGKVSIGKYPITGGADGGTGRLELSKAQARKR